MERKLSVNERIRLIEEENQKGLDLAQRMSKAEYSQIRSTRELEEQKYEEFKEIVKGQRYFRLEHIDKLGIPYDILIHLSAKNAGKTTHIYRCIDKCLERGEKFIYGRVMEQELQSEMIKFREDEDSSVQIIENRGRYYFFKKSDIEDYVNEAIDNKKKGQVSFDLLQRAGIDYVGLGIIFMNSNQLGGGKYDDYTTIFFDEIVSYHPKKYINDSVMYNWACAVSTILRNKAKLHIIMMGNLKPEKYIPVLDYYDIDVSDNLRIVRRVIKEGSDPCTILYVNSGCLYTNTLGNQGSVAHHAKLYDRIFQLHNKLVNSSTKVITRRIFEDMTYMFAFAFNTIDGPLVFHVRRSEVDPDSDEKSMFCLSVTELNLTTYVDGNIWVDFEDKLKAEFSILKQSMAVDMFIEWIHNMSNCDILYYDSVKSLSLMREYFSDLLRFVERQKSKNKRRR